MGDKSNIEWTDATWNPIVGCSLASPGCTHCYAMGEALRLAANPNTREKYAGLVKVVKGRPVWTGQLNVWEPALKDPIRWRRPRMIFVNSMSDLFHDGLPDVEIDKIFAAMALAPHHQFQILTKRAERMQRYIESWPDGAGRIHHVAFAAKRLDPSLPDRGKDAWVWKLQKQWPLPNVFLGISVEDQKRWDERGPHIIALKAQGWRTMISGEPLLGPFTWALGDASIHRPDWFIVGGESGRFARPCHPDWVRHLRDQCMSMGVPFFFKQWGAWWPDDGQPGLHGQPQMIPAHRDDGVRRFGDGLIVRKVGKRRAGRKLDGRLHDAMPGFRRAA